MLSDFIRATLRAKRALRLQMRTRQLVSDLAQDPNPSFTEDYVTVVAGRWEECLNEFRDRPYLRMLEIGSFEGASAIWYLDNILTQPTSELICVDVFPSLVEERFDHNISVSGSAKKVTKMKGRSDALVPSLPLESFDLIYVDGSHRAIDVLMDGVLAWQRLKPGGILIFDDYLWSLQRPLNERPQMAVDLCLELFAGRFELVLKDYQVMLRKN
jgi:SAM-dependent methyltransferase